jgi:hypothetical protein
MRRFISIVTLASMFVTSPVGAFQTPAPSPQADCVRIKLQLMTGGSYHGATEDLGDLSAAAIPIQVGGHDTKAILVFTATQIQDDRVRTAIRDLPQNLIVRSPNVAAVPALLTQKAGTPQIIAVVPIDPEPIAAVFGPEHKNRQDTLAYMRKVEARFSAIKDAVVISRRNEGSPPIAEQILVAARGPRKDIFILMAHNEKGSIKFPDDSTLPISEIEKALATAGRPGIILSCNTINASVDGPLAVLTTKSLHFDDIAAAMSTARRKLSCVAGATYADFISALDESLNEAASSSNQRIKMVFASVGGSVLVGVAYALVQSTLSPSDDKKARKLPLVPKP